MTLWSALKAGFGFLSVLPVGITMEGIEELMNRLYLYPVVGALLGILIGLGAFIFELFLPSPVTILFIMFAIYGLTWFNHLDGIADMGDGMTAHGSLEKKRKALKDMALGIGGVAFTVFSLLFLYASLLALESGADVFGNMMAIGMTGSMANGFLWFGFLSILLSSLSAHVGLEIFSAVSVALVMGFSVWVAEILAKQSMLTIATFGKSFSEGLGSMTIKGGSSRNFAIGIVFSLLVSVGLLGILGILAVFVTTLVAGFILRTSNKHFSGLNGDGIGAANEIGRAAAICTISISIWILGGGLSWML
ncbi:adenosylcobinamide-GDP ribazoletransferase [Methanolapillus ohkumae]|uniref:Adenosylcobinamide-GDP ribazoletransferase n=1 Tax=Methanolapillus ohkumae TaxID=3028298 RepID=A0AA96V6D2_9EURY|nr:Adenosylcobinamide-GDP ribazoletransferase [Methanosarcinaceae archaeon Am2]